ncbi:NAD(P)-binding protein [Aspergillus heteromorphus CBS 117.55]|uniref:NAD(P)-binding protein n=1 Tax=Aspergillus heteromorphus CBS 117.55 TaxID=1448321 RepID=A0A317W276_9EURO|nr:NAD(P)-binding protein [Aspergillus heteromorphus CBS 117.55]PWY79691.1 NAD(P)-binding protein [Aspergillus heteromorphus CBS 117.55]
MVHIALAGGYGGLGQEILDALIQTGKHNITILSRRDRPAEETRPEIHWTKIDYADKPQLVQALHGVHTVLSFIVVAQDRGNASQRTLIDACVDAGVKRFAPSEWAGANTDGLPWYAGKTAIHRYLQELNREKEVLEYCCFRPGMLMNYLAYPLPTTQHVEIWGIHVDMQNKRAILLADARNPGYLGLTTVEDVANVVVRAVEYPGKWPEVGGMRGQEISMGELIALGEEIRGATFSVETIKAGQARLGRLTASWHPVMQHSTIPEEVRAASAKIFTAKTVASIYQGTWRVSDEWNRLLPDYRFTGVEEFLRKWWTE